MTTTEDWYQKQKYSTHRVDKEKLGWDLVAWNKEEYLRIEVKGLSGSFVAVDLTPNEYEKMRKHRTTFHISVVPKALSSKPSPRIFIYSPSKQAWQDDEGQLVIRERIGARLSEKTLG